MKKIKVKYKKHWASPTRIITTRKIIIPQWMSIVLLTLVLLGLFSIGQFFG